MTRPYGAAKRAIVSANAAHPNWNTRQIADHIGCSVNQVTSAISRYALDIPLADPVAAQREGRRTRNAEAVRKVFRAEAGLAKEPRIMTAFATLAAVGDVEMLDRVMRSLRI